VIEQVVEPNCAMVDIQIQKRTVELFARAPRLMDLSDSSIRIAEHALARRMQVRVLEAPMSPSLANPSASLGQFRSHIELLVLSIPMAFIVYAIVSVALVFSTALPAHAGPVEQAQLLQGQTLSNRGEFGQAVRVLEPLVHSSSGALDDVSRGTAWNILGPAYESLGDFQAARHSYEMAIQLLQAFPAARQMYASALTNLGSLDTYMGQLKAAKALLRKASRLYARTNDHNGLAEVAINFAMLAIVRNDTHVARGFIVQAFAQAERAKDVSDSDWAAMYSIRGSLSARALDFAVAVREYQQSIDFWIRARGPKCHYVALQYTLQADAYRELGEYSEASRDITVALAIEEQIGAGDTELYASTELSYARLLRAMGKNASAEEAERRANASLEAMPHQQCNGCSIGTRNFEVGTGRNQVLK